MSTGPDTPKTGAGASGDARANVNRDPEDLSTPTFDLPRVKPGTDRESEFLYGIPNVSPTPDSLSWTREDREEPIPCRIHLGTSMVPQARSSCLEEGALQIAPPPIAKLIR